MPNGDEPFKHRWLALIVVSMGVFLIALDIAIVGIAAPSLSAALGATATEIQWAFDAFTVVLAGFVVLGGGLGERYGRKGWVQAGMLLFASGATISGLAPNIGVLIAGRIVSGLGAAIVFPACLSIITALFPESERHRAVGIFAAISAAGLGGGPLVGGALIHWFWWGAAFLFVVPIAVASVVAMAVIVPTSRGSASGPLDAFGALLSVLGLGGLVFGVIEGPDRGWGTPLVFVPVAIGLLCTAGFIFWELRISAPLFDLRVFKDPRVVGGGLAMAVVYFTFNSSQLLIPQYFIYVRNLTDIQAGLAMSPFGISLALLSPPSSRLVARYGQRAMLVFSLACMAAGLSVIALLPVWGGVANVVIGICIYGVGFGLIVAPATSAVMVAIPREKAGDGSAVNMVSRQIGGAFGVAIVGSVASIVYRHGLRLSEFSLTESQRQGVERSLSGVIAIRDTLDATVASKLDHMADASMTQGVAAAMGLSAAVAAAVAAIAFFAMRRQ